MDIKEVPEVAASVEGDDILDNEAETIEVPALDTPQQEVTDHDVDVLEEAVPEDDDKLDQIMEEKYGERGTRYDLRPCKAQMYAHLFVTNGKEAGVVPENKSLTPDNASEESVSKATPQMGVKQGLKMFGSEGLLAIKKEMEQLHSRDVIKPIHNKIDS